MTVISHYFHLYHPDSIVAILSSTKLVCCSLLKKKDVWYKTGVTRDLLRTPFDLRFPNLLARLCKHGELYELELYQTNREELMLSNQRSDKELVSIERIEDRNLKLPEGKGKWRSRPGLVSSKINFRTREYRTFNERKSQRKPENDVFHMLLMSFNFQSNGSRAVQYPRLVQS